MVRIVLNLSLASFHFFSVFDYTTTFGFLTQKAIDSIHYLFVFKEFAMNAVQI